MPLSLTSLLQRTFMLCSKCMCFYGFAGKGSEMGLSCPLSDSAVQVGDQSEELNIQFCPLHFHSSVCICVCVCSPTAVITSLCHQLPIITPGSIGSIQL